jgi:hypothetical protein
VAGPASEQAQRADGIAVGSSLGTIFCSCALVLAIAVIQPQRSSRNNS